jgi:hypothetical protein
MCVQSKTPDYLDVSTGKGPAAHVFGLHRLTAHALTQLLPTGVFLRKGRRAFNLARVISSDWLNQQSVYVTDQHGSIVGHNARRGT